MVRFTSLVFAVVFLVVGCVAVPTENEAEDYTRAKVQDAIRFYDRYGRDATIEYYSSEERLAGEWYVFIVGVDGYTVASPTPGMIGRDPALRVDASGYFYGDDLLSATTAGKWITYIFPHPQTGEDARKYTWVVRHDGLLFASGFYPGE